MKKIRKGLDSEVNRNVSYTDLWMYIAQYGLEVTTSGGDGIDYVHESDKANFNKYLRHQLDI